MDGLQISIRTGYAKNYGQPMQYFIPEWDDRVDPNYNFITDMHTVNRDTYNDDVYAHEIYENPCYDGVLISKIKIDESKKKRAKVEETTIQEFLRLPNHLPIIGDCGAFGYIGQHEPPYKTEEILNYYETLGFDIGVSIDHLIVGKIEKDPEERLRRYKLTQDNAADFINKHNEGKYTFKPSGVAQGWDVQSYKEAVIALIEMGYEHISLGGLVRARTNSIIGILESIKPYIPDYLQLHLFGIARIDAVKEFRELGVTSFDSASPLRRAWLGAGSNYFTIEGDKYTAIRVPPVNGHNVRVRRMIEEGRGSQEMLEKLEQKALSSLRAYDRNELDLEETLQDVLAYDELIGDKREGHENMYRRVLEDRPWKSCDCKICQQIGIEVIIFRGNNRNRRRGFHNTYVFYKRFKNLCPDI